MGHWESDLRIFSCRVAALLSFCLSGHLHSTSDPSNLISMKSGGVIVIYLLLAAVLCSSWAGVPDPCGELGNGDHVGHAVAQDSSDHQHQHAQARDYQPEDVDCPCCDDCATACVLSACNPAMMAFAAPAANYNGSNRFVRLVTLLHDGPAVHPPF